MLCNKTRNEFPIDWYRAYFEVNFKLVTLADSAVGITAGANNGNQDCTTTNGHTFIKEIKIDCNGKSVYNNTSANETSNVLSLLNYLRGYADTVGKNQFFYLDTSTGTTEARPAQDLYNAGFARRKILTDAANVNKFIIPLNLYSYFAAFKDNLHPNSKIVLEIVLEEDANIIFRKGAAPNSKVILTKLRLWCPKIIFNPIGGKQYLSDYLKPKKWSFMKEVFEIKETTSVNGSFVIGTGIRRPRHVFIWVVPVASYNNQEQNIFTFKTFNIGANNRYFTSAQIKINNTIRYPETDFTSEVESRLYHALMSFNFSYDDFLSAPIIDQSNFRNLFGILYFDLRNQEDDIKNGDVSLKLEYQLNGANPTNYRLNALVLQEEHMELYTQSGKLMVRA